jgi:purine nucleosidase
VKIRKAIIDSDTATDDTIAILIALKYFKLLGVTIVAGNVEFEDQVKNALYTLEYFGADNVNVYLGAKRPILGIWKYAKEVHGDNGLSNWVVRPTRKPSNENAIDLIIKLAREYQGELEVLAISPLTNIALAYLKNPEIVDMIKKLWIMGGAVQKGNVTPIAEYNFWVDPEAAKIVLSAGFNITLVTWDLAEKYGLIAIEDWEKIKKMNTKSSIFFINSNISLLNYTISKQSLNGSIHPDSLTVVIASFPEIIKKSKMVYADVELCSNSRGALLVDWYNLTGNKPNIELVLEIDYYKFKEVLFEILSSN